MFYRIILLVIVLTSCQPDISKENTGAGNPVFEVDLIATLPDDITESSGIVTINNKLYTHNDTRGNAQLYQLTKDGRMESKTTFDSINVRDWEDITVDQTHVYIADIGNNLGNKTDLKIYKLPIAEIENATAQYEVIEFSFADQTDFSNTVLNQTAYDVEAITSLDNYLYLFTKDWLAGNTRVYQLSKQPGVYNLDPIATIDIQGLVTGATTSPEGDIIISGYNSTLLPFVARIQFASDRTPSLTDKKNLINYLGNPSQIEGITYFGMIDNQPTYYLTSEQYSTSLFGNPITLEAHLYQIRWNE